VLRDRLDHVRQRIREACQRCGRDASSVTLIAVTKMVDATTIREAVALGLRDLGENRVQEAQEKRRAVGDGVRWHLVGHLQRNKAKPAVELFDAIHSVDTPELVEELDRQASRQGRGVGQGAGGRGRTHPLQVLIQVNVSREATKSGCGVDEVHDLAQHVMRQPNLQLAGLMTIAPFADNPEAVRPVFRRLRALRDELQQALPPVPHAPRPVPLLLSMGMSQDFEVAIEEGADIVRIGTAIFGARDKGQGARESQ